MQLESFCSLLADEPAAQAYFNRLAGADENPLCPKCGRRMRWRLADGRSLCPGCRFKGHALSGRFIDVGALSARQKIWLIKLFCLEIDEIRAGLEVGVVRNTVAKFYRACRASVLAGSLDAPILIDAGVCPWPGHAKPGKDLVFGVMEKEGWAFVDLLPDVKAEDLLHFRRRFHLKAAKLGSLVITAPFKSYGALIAPAGPEDGKLKDPVRALATDKGFWRFAAPRLKAKRGVSPAWLPLHLKELEFRYNHRKGDLFTALSERLCAVAPNCGQV